MPEKAYGSFTDRVVVFGVGEGRDRRLAGIVRSSLIRKEYFHSLSVKAVSGGVGEIYGERLDATSMVVVFCFLPNTVLTLSCAEV